MHLVTVYRQAEGSVEQRELICLQGFNRYYRHSKLRVETTNKFTNKNLHRSLISHAQTYERKGELSLPAFFPTRPDPDSFLMQFHYIQPLTVSSFPTCLCQTLSVNCVYFSLDQLVLHYWMARPCQ